MASQQLDETPSSASKSTVMNPFLHFPIMIVVLLLLAIENGIIRKPSIAC
jgi:hypothetical protein